MSLERATQLLYQMIKIEAIKNGYVHTLSLDAVICLPPKSRNLRYPDIGFPWVSTASGLSKEG